MLCPARSPAWPCVASGRKDAAASSAVMSVGVHERQANASTVMIAPKSVVMSQDWPSGSSSRKRPSCVPNSRSMLSFGLKAAMKARNPARPAEIVNTAAPTEAMFSAASNERSPARNPNRASTREPSITAPDMFITSLAIGVPQSTNGPGSCRSGGLAPPPTRSASVSATSAAMRRMTIPAMRYAEIRLVDSLRELTPPA